MTEKLYTHAELISIEKRVIVATLAIGIVAGGMVGLIAGVSWPMSLHECHSQEVRPCVFGPAIAGQQTCDWSDQWRPCEPDPRYRADDKKGSP